VKNITKKKQPNTPRIIEDLEMATLRDDTIIMDMLTPKRPG